MSDSDWSTESRVVIVVTAVFLLVILCMGVWDVSALNTKEAITASHRASEYAENTNKQITERCTMANLADLQTCVNEIVKSSRDNQRAEYDLVAQNAVARWTFWLLIFAVVGTGVTLIGVYFLQANLSEMQKQRALNKSAVDAAIESNKIAREIGEAQVRAYISVTGGRIDLSVSDFLLLGHVEINYINNGLSPAFHVIFDLSLIVIEKPNLVFPEVGDVEQYSCQIPSQISLTVAAGKTETFRQAILKSSVPNEWRENIAAGRVRLLVNGTLRWTDVFNVVETNRIFCLENTDRDYFAVVPPKGDLRVTQMRLSQKKATE